MYAMRTLTRLLIAASGASLVGLGPRVAWAQAIDVNPPLPNVLLLINTSGSMEYLIPSPTSGNTLVLPGSASPPDGSACGYSNTSTTVGTPPATTVFNRWTTLVTTLTGSIAPGSFTCETVDRGAQIFVNEYGLSQDGYSVVPPYDYKYFLPFHRIYINNCTLAPNTQPGISYTMLPYNPPNPWAWPAQPFATHDQLWNGNAYTNYNQCSQSGQAADGLLDVFQGRIRFGMMMFDTLPDPGTGASAAGTAVNPTTGERGMWSYYNDWTSTLGTPAMGMPTGCTVANAYEVGARNQVAPPWEGRLVRFGDWNNDSHVASTNNIIQNEILAMRPYGGTPIAGIMDDAYQFLFADPTLDLSTTGSAYRSGPSDDQYWINGCRKTYLVLLTDGSPNEDMSGECAPGHGCPYLPPDQTASILAGTSYFSPYASSPPSTESIPTAQQVLTYVVGFALSDLSQLPPGAIPASDHWPAGITDCTTIDQPTIQNICPHVTSPILQACCSLQKIAMAGGTSHAYFAADPTTLKSQLSNIFATIGSGTTARTWPVYFPRATQTHRATHLARKRGPWRTNSMRRSTCTR